MGGGRFHNIPEELKLRNQWVSWRYVARGAGKPTKVLLNARTGFGASVSDPLTWSDFATAVAATHNCDGIGYVFSEGDPYAGIDLDAGGDVERQEKVFRAFDSYSEISPSGSGLHIIVKGQVPKGVNSRRDNIEIYSSGRYFTFTGDVYNPAPIQERQAMLATLWKEIGGGKDDAAVIAGVVSSNESDAEIYEAASAAVNRAKFNVLWAGDWQSLYPSQSEADFALIDILAFYTQDREQVMRMFRSSGLGKRDKAKRSDYVGAMVRRSFDRQLPMIDLSGFQELSKKMLNGGGSSNGRTTGFGPVYAGSMPAPSANDIPLAYSDIPETSPVMERIPGMLGQIADFIYRAAPRPVEEIAIAAAIGLMAGIGGRVFNISGTGLNQYIIVVANSGRGKEAMASGIDKLMGSIQANVPNSRYFIGPSDIMSAQALTRYLGVHRCFVSIVGEFGLRLQQLCHPRASPSEIGLRKSILDFYNKSGFGQIARPMIYADPERNTLEIKSPAFSILGETTPERLYSILTEEFVNDGLIPRFSIIEYTGRRVHLNERHGDATISAELMAKMLDLTEFCIKANEANLVYHVGVDFDAKQVLDDYDQHATDQINHSERSIVHELWNRAHIKAMKLAALIAVGVNHHAPVVSRANAVWAIAMVNRDIHKMMKRFELGDVGASNEESKQISEVIRICKKYLKSDWETVSRLHVGSEQMHRESVIPYSYISKNLISTMAFRGDRMGATKAVQRSIQNLIDTDRLRPLGKQQLTGFKTTQLAYVLSDIREH